MRVLDTATILAAMAQVSSRGRGSEARAPARATPAIRVVEVHLPAGRARACHRPAPALPRTADDQDGGRATLVVVPHGVIPIMVASSRLARAEHVRAARH